MEGWRKLFFVLVVIPEMNVTMLHFFRRRSPQA
jgi:hypothetical protein